MKLATRYGLAGIAPLALLAVVHWLRERRQPLGPVGDYLVGVLPNFCAALAITFVLLSIWADQQKDATPLFSRRAFLWSASISGVGLTAWELFQRSSDRLVFDPHDLGATGIGLVAATLVYFAVTPRTTV